LLAATSSTVSPPKEGSQSRSSSCQSTPVSNAISSHFGPPDEGQELCTAPALLLSAWEKRGQKLRGRDDPQIGAALSEISAMAAWGDSMEASAALTPYSLTNKASKPLPICSQKLLTSPRVRVMGIGDALCLRRGLAQRPASARSAPAGGAGGGARASKGTVRSSHLADATNVQERCWEYLRQRYPILAERHSQSYVQARKGGCNSRRSSQAGQKNAPADMSCISCSDALCIASPRSGSKPVPIVDTDARRARELISARFSQYLSRSTLQQKLPAVTAVQPAALPAIAT